LVARGFRLWVFAALVLGCQGVAGALTVQLSADRTRVGVGDVFSVTVAMTIEDGADVPDPDLKLPPGFDVISSRSSTFTSISIVNGAVSQTRSVNVVSTVRGNKEGAFTLGPATMTTGGRTMRSQAIRIDVLKGLSKSRTTAQPSQDAVSTDQLRESEENLFIKATLDQKTVYVGEQILLSYDLYSRYRIQNPRFGVVPSYTGFWAEKVFEASRLEQRPEVVNGKSFNKSRLKQIALFPTVPGTQKLEQMEFVCDVPIRSRRRSVFDVDDFFSWDPFRSRQVTVRAPDLEIEVLSLPGGAPDEFSGGVGIFRISATPSLTSVTQGDPVTVNVVVSGKGNLHGVGEPTRPGTTDFKFYDPKGSVVTRVEGTVLAGEKAFEYVTIPTSSGEVTLPPFRFAYFDPKKERYQVLKTQPIVMSVTPGEKTQQVTLMTAPSGSAVQVVGEDIRYIKADVFALENHASYLHQSGVFWSLQLVPLVCLFVAWQFRKRQLVLAGDVGLARKLRSRGEAKKRLSGARSLVESDGVSFYAEIRRALSAFLADRVNLDIQELTAAQARKALEEQAVTASVIESVVSVLDACDFARFAPGAGGTEDRVTLLEKVESLIDALERAT
jgi:hypothetical protein